MCLCVWNRNKCRALSRGLDEPVSHVIEVAIDRFCWLSAHFGADLERVLHSLSVGPRGSKAIFGSSKQLKWGLLYPLHLSFLLFPPSPERHRGSKIKSSQLEKLHIEKVWAVSLSRCLPTTIGFRYWGGTRCGGASYLWTETRLLISIQLNILICMEIIHLRLIVVIWPRGRPEFHPAPGCLAT